MEEEEEEKVGEEEKRKKWRKRKRKRWGRKKRRRWRKRKRRRWGNRKRREKEKASILQYANEISSILEILSLYLVGVIIIFSFIILIF